MKKTCKNCAYYHGTISDNNDGWHAHNYCSLWKTTIPAYTIFERLGYVGGFDDIECDLAYCWGFYPREEESNLPSFSMEDNDIDEECVDTYFKEWWENNK